ncbi:hypothetical protein [Rummeliibacillus suwonensis]|uniref:hypothetical protein n=1 Tax=Rummeliibacillus suwonensis TaxID=1306154 RepID=UPI001AAF53A6|nr:hypothetical protein [Rummeliibacillus suwonensis]MBO2535991.1 hypothetical protein [Rummeliibacillus suwonensis]
MAIDLKAILRLDDRLSKQLSNVDRAIERTNRSSSSLGRALNSASKQGSSGMGNVTKVIGGVTAAIGGAVSAAKLFQSTIGAAMAYEQQDVLITAMFDDKKASTSYTKMINKMAQASPVMDSSAMMNSSSGLVSITKNVGELEKAWKLIEKMSVANPTEGIDGAVFALKEMASGDYVSMSERFNVDKTTLKDLKSLSFEDQLAGLTKYMDKAGYTNATIEAMGNTTLGKWQQIKERMGSVFRGMGENGGQGIGKALDGVLTKINSPAFEKFASTMNVKIGQAITYATDKAIKMANFIQTHWSGISTTVKIVGSAFIALKAIGFLVGTFKTISTAVGVAVKVFKVARTVFSVLRLTMLAFPSTWILAAIAAIIAAGILLYKNWNKVKAVWSSVWKSIKQNAADSVNSVIGKINALIGTINKIPGVNIPIIPKVNWGASEVAPAKALNKKTPQLGSMVNYAPKNYGGLNLPGHKGGLARVPYDGYVARLHESEQILTAKEAQDYRESKYNKPTANSTTIQQGGNTYHFNFTMQGSGYTKKDAQQIFEYIVNETYRAGNAGA